MSTNQFNSGNTDETFLNDDYASTTSGTRSATSKVNAKVNDLVSSGLQTVKDQYRVVKEQGVQGVKDDVVGYARREPTKALLVAGGIGALLALILRRR